jgi:hypothetical protein
MCANGRYPQISRGTESSGSAIWNFLYRKSLHDDGHSAATRTAVPIEVDEKNPPLERERAGGRRRFFHAGSRSAIDLLSDSEELEVIAEQSRGEPCGHAVRKDSRIHGSPIQV